MLDQSLLTFGAFTTGGGLPAFDGEGWRRLFDADDVESRVTAPVEVLPGVGIVLKPSRRSAREAVQAAVDPLRQHMDRLKLGDQAAFAALHKACASRVLAFVQRIVKRHELADEVASNVFMQVWRDAAQFDPARGGTYAWICAIARSRSLDLLRQVATRRRHEDQLDDSEPEGTADTAAGPHDLLQSTRLRKALVAGLARLTPAQRHVLRLTFFEGLSHEEVAAAASLPLGTVKSHARRGLAALRTNSAIVSMAS